MKNHTQSTPGITGMLFALLAMLPLAVAAQVPVDEDGNLIGDYDAGATGNEEIPLLSADDLEELVGPVALYPDDLLAIVLPASAYPLQIIEAGRFLEALEQDPTLKPDPEWDDSVVALLNYPEVVELLNEDIDWTWRLGEAVVAQQVDVVAAVEDFRDRAYAAGNLKSDGYQNVERADGVIEITPVSDDIIYVPYYEPERVVVYQPRPVYYYYPRAYPVYYYPYAANYYFDRGYFWGVTTAFTIGWMSDSLHVYHHSYHGHPYYGHSYWDNWWYRRPSIRSYNTTYVNNTRITVNRYYSGDRWTPRRDRHAYVNDHRETRNRHITRTRSTARHDGQTARTTASVRRQEPISFRERAPQRNESQRRTAQRSDAHQGRRQASQQSTRQNASERPARVESRGAGRQRQDSARESRQTPVTQARTPTVRERRPSATTERPARRPQAAVDHSANRESRRSRPTVNRDANRSTRRSEPAASRPAQRAPERQARHERPDPPGSSRKSESRPTERKRSADRGSSRRDDSKREKARH